MKQVYLLFIEIVCLLMLLVNSSCSSSSSADGGSIKDKVKGWWSTTSVVDNKWAEDENYLEGTSWKSADGEYVLNFSTLGQCVLTTKKNKDSKFTHSTANYRKAKKLVTVKMEMTLDRIMNFNDSLVFNDEYLILQMDDDSTMHAQDYDVVLTLQ